MDIAVLSRGNYTDFVLGRLSKTKKPDILVFSSGIIDRLNFFDELGGKSTVFYDLCLLSESMDCVIICACDTEVCGTLHKSAVLIDCGKLAGVSDMAQTDSESGYSPGGGFRVYETSRGKIGLIVGEDIYNPEIPKMLSLCGSDIIISLFGIITNHLPQLMMRAAAFSSGVCICMAAQGYIQISDIKGEMICATDADLLECEIEIIKDYRLLLTRSRGSVV
jgi:predicted amidohydrolase